MAHCNDNNKLLHEHIEGEFTLDDTYDHLMDIYKELHDNAEKLMINYCDLNNDSHTLIINLTTPDHIEEKEHKLSQRLLKHNYSYDHRINPISHTIDVYEMGVWELEREVIDIQKMFDKLKVDVLMMKDNIACLEMENKSLERLTETCVDVLGKYATEGSVNDGEMMNAKKLFISVKKDLESTVDTIFPKHTEFKELLGELTTAYIKGGGDQVYANIDSKYIDCVKFMMEADIVTYHRNDRNKLRLVDLL